MNRFIISLIAFFFLGILSSQVFAQNMTPEEVRKKQIRDHLLFNSAQGREFWIAIPPNEVASYPTQVLEIFVTASVQTQATIKSPTMGVNITKNVKPLSITTFSSETGETTFQWEIRRSEKVTDKGLQITSPQPLSVYVLNAKSATSEGYLALPRSAWGTEYIHCSYYDHNEIRKWKTGFIIIAAEKNTRVRITLRGRGAAGTLGGHNLGDIITENLDAGQTFMVQGNGETRGFFDMTGSKVVADKPIGFISTHERTHIPSYDIWNGRDHLAEMMPPVHAWGKEYITIEYKRDSGQGDFFRVVAAEDNTRFICKYYSIQNGEQLGTWEGQMKNAGDFQEYLQEHVQAGNKLKSIRGASIFTADKPILVMQYSYSAYWDGNDIFDPFMILVVPVEQYIPTTVFQTPSSKAFQDNWFNIIAKHDPKDSKFEDLKSIKVDGKKVSTLEPSFVLNKIPTKDLYWAKLRMDPGAHKVSGDTEFGGYIYGFSTFDSYGWPAAMAINKLDELDTLEPELYPEGVCGDYTIRATEFRNGEEGDDPRQVDQGISQIKLLDGSYNYELDPNDFEPWPVNYDHTFYLNLIDPFKSGLAIYAVTDRAGNVNIDTLSYEPDSLKLDPETVAFGEVRLRTTKEEIAVLENVSDSTIKILKIALQTAKFYEITDGAVPPEMELAPGDTHQIRIEYSPTRESLREDDLDIDSLLVTTECLEYKWEINGRGVIPRIYVADWDALTIPVGETKCITEEKDGLRIRNTGTATLEIYGIEDIDLAPFSMPETIPEFTFTIPPGEEVYLKEICFEAVDTLDHYKDVVFKSNTDTVPHNNYKDTSHWHGAGMQPGPVITSVNWKERRVLTVNDSAVYMTNVGDTKVLVNSFKLDDENDNSMEILYNQITPKETNIELYPLTENNSGKTTKITIPVRFVPQDEQDYENFVIPVFGDETVETGTVRGRLEGIGILPKIDTLGYEFAEIRYIQGEQNISPETGQVKIRSTSQSADLYIESIEWEDPNQQEFEFTRTPPSDTVITRGDSLVLDVIFHPSQPQATVVERVEVVSDAETGPDRDPRITHYPEVIGHSFQVGWSVNELDFGPVLLCDPEEDHFTIFNNSQNQDIIDVKINKFAGDVTLFEITNIPDRISANDEGNVGVRYSPEYPRASEMQVEVEVTFENSNVTEKDTTLVKGEGYKVPVTLKLPELDKNAAGIPVEIPITIVNNKANESKITEFEIDVLYETDWMTWLPAGDTDNEIAQGEALVPNSWNVTGVETRDPVTGMARLRITAAGTMPVKGGENVLVRPRFLLLLTESLTTFHPEISLTKLENSGFGDRTICIIPDTTRGEVTINSCVIDLRHIEYTGDDYLLESISPNPVTDEGFTLKYGVGLEGRTKIELHNSKGVLVDILVDAVTDPGYYEQQVKTSDLPAGVYFLKMQSGPFTKMRRIVITK